MKLTFKAKLIVDIKRYKSDYPTFTEIQKLINNGDVRIEFIGAWLSQDFEPTIIFEELDE